jgi:DnaJ-class molecular chaperone
MKLIIKIPTTALNELANVQIVYENAQFEESSFSKQKLIEYQLCPKCNGQGTTSRPPWVPYDQNEWTSSNSSYLCNICNGAGIIPKATM